MRLRTLSVLDAAALVATGATHWLELAPRARRELRHWRRRAQSTPNLVLRDQALGKLTDEALNPEAAAFFAILAPRAGRRALTRLIVAYQAMYDYLDAVNEPTAAAPLGNGLRLHSSLVHAIQPAAVPIDYYAHHPRRGDGGYLETLRSACYEILERLPSAVSVAETLGGAAARCGETQARNHAIVVDGSGQLIRWSRAQAPSGGYLWWELAAAGISCLAIHALFATAATPMATSCEAQRVLAAYFPPVCALSALLDSLVDLPDDDGTINHSFAAHYDSPALAAERCVAIATAADEQMRDLRHARRHRVILAGILGYYFSAPGAKRPFTRLARARALHVWGPMVRLTIAAMSVRRRGRTVA